jgi:uncharacterized phage protein (TIGR02220 family)
LAWIKFDKDLVNDPRIIRAAGGLAESYTLSVERSRGDGFAIGNDLSNKEATDLMRNAVIGALVTLWVYADTHIRNGDLLPISMEEINQMVGIDGFCEMVGPEWIQETNYGIHTILPGYCEKNGLLSREKRRADNAERQRRYREKHNAESNAVSNADVTAPRPRPRPIPKTEQNTVGQRPDLKPLALEVLDFLNSKTGRNYEAVPANLELISARLRDGASVDDLRAVVAKKTREWAGDEKMAQYLRPATLFNRTKFAQYKGELGVQEAA